MQIKRRHGRNIIIAPGTLEGKNHEAESPAQSPLVLALAKAHAWMDAFESGEIGTVQELSEKVGLDFSYISRILRLVNLAPDLQEAIINGEEPDGLSLGKLRGNLPESWEEQRKLFREM